MTIQNSAPVSDTVKKLLPWLVAIAFFMESLDTTILNTAVPIMSKALGVAVLSMKSVLSSYTLSLAVFIPMSSWMADRFGTRKVFSFAIGIFTLGSLLCGIANNIHLLVFCRILQGCGGAMMIPVGRLTLVRSFPKSELVRAMNFLAVPALIGPLLGPLIGGLIVNYFHWRMIFYVNAPIGLLGLWFVNKYLPDFKSNKSYKLDFIGLTLFGCGVALLSYILEVFGETTLSSREIIGLFILAILLLSAYGFHAKSNLHPLLRLGLLRIRTLRAAVGGTFFTRLGAGGMPFLLPLLYQVGLGYTPIQSGLLIIPQSVAAIGLRYWVPQMLVRFGYRNLLLANTIIIGFSIMLFSTINHNTSIGIIILIAGCFGFFSSLQYTCMSTLAYADIHDQEASMASTILSTVQQMSLSFGVATASLVAAYFIADRVHASPEDMTQGLHKAFFVLGFVTILSAFGFHELKKTDGDNISNHKH